jgi:hypothetical protein
VCAQESTVASAQAEADASILCGSTGPISQSGIALRLEGREQLKYMKTKPAPEWSLLSDLRSNAELETQDFQKG